MILGPDNRRAALRVDSDGRLLTAGSEGTAGPAGDSYMRPLICSHAPRQLTGGTVGVETLLLEVPLPFGFFADVRNFLEVRTAWWYSLNTNSKSFAVKIGTSLGASQSLFSRTRTSASQGQDTSQNMVSRDPDVATSLRRFGDSGSTFFGAAGVNSASSPVSPSAVDITGQVSLFFTATLGTVNTDQVTLAGVYAWLHRADGV